MARAKRETHPLLQVLFEPWPASTWEHTAPDAYSAFAGQYLLDALDESGAFIDRGYRAVVEGCTTCRRSDADERVHWPNLNDLAPDKPKRRCPRWKTVEAVVKSFGGWKRVHYVELAESEGLRYEPIPQRRREVVTCSVCEGTGFGDVQWTGPTNSKPVFPPCPGECRSYNYRSRGEVQLSYEGPVRADRFGMSDAQLRVRT